MFLGDGDTMVGPGDMIGQCGEDDPLALGLGQMTYPKECRIRVRFILGGSFVMDTHVSGSFGSMKPTQSIIV